MLYFLNYILFFALLSPIICEKTAVAVTDVNTTTTTKTVTVTNGTTKHIHGQTTATAYALTNINISNAFEHEGNAAKETTKKISDTKVISKTRITDQVQYTKSNVSVAHTESVSIDIPPTLEAWSPTEPNSPKIADQLKQIEKLSNILPVVEDKKVRGTYRTQANIKPNANATAIKDLEVFAQHSLLRYVDPEAEVVVFRRNERSQRQISNSPQELDAHDTTETHISKSVPQNFDRGIFDPTILDTVDGFKKQVTPPQNNLPLNNNNESEKLIREVSMSDLHKPFLNLSQCVSYIAESLKTINNKQIDKVPLHPIQIPNTDFLKTQNLSENDHGNHQYLSSILQNPRLLQGYRRINHKKALNSNFLRAKDAPDHFLYKIFKPSYLSKVDYSQLVPGNSAYTKSGNNDEPNFSPLTQKNVVTNIPDINNLYPWFWPKSSSSNPIWTSQSLPPSNSFLMAEPEMEVKSASTALPVPKILTPLGIDKNKFEYYDTLINMISRKNAASDTNKFNEIDPVKVVIDSSVKDAANEKLIIKMNEFKQQIAKLKAEATADGQEKSETELQQMLFDKNNKSGPQSEKVTEKQNPLSNQSETKSGLSSRKTEKKNKAREDGVLFELNLPNINIDVFSNRRAIDSKNENNLQRQPTEPLDILIKRLLLANGLDNNKIESFWPQLLTLLGTYLPKYVPYYSYPPHQISNDNTNIQNVNMAILPTTDNVRNIDVKQLSTLNVISNVTDHIAEENTQNNETLKINVADSKHNAIQSLLASHNVTNNTDTISLSTTILLDVTDNDTNLDPNDVRRHLEVIKNENNANNASVLLINEKNYDEILKSLDSFTLERKKAYVTVPTEKPIQTSDVGRSNNNRTVDPNFLDKVFGEYRPEKDVTIGPAKEKPADSKDFLDNPQIFSALKKQTELMGKLLLRLRGENTRRNAGKDFQDLIKEVEAKKHGIGTPEVIEDINKRIGDETKKPGATVMSLVDETEVRKALRNSPYVKRILKLSKQKRDRYLKRKKASERKRN